MDEFEQVLVICVIIAVMAIVIWKGPVDPYDGAA